MSIKILEPLNDLLLGYDSEKDKPDFNYINEHQLIGSGKGVKYPKECDQCNAVLGRMDKYSQHFNCIECGIWCTDCMINAYYRINNIKKTKTLNEWWTILSYDKQITYSNSCLCCRKQLKSRTAAAISSVYIPNITSIISSYIDFEEQAILEYNYPRERVMVRCLYCPSKHSRPRHLAAKLNYEICCSACREYSYRNYRLLMQLNEIKKETIKRILYINSKIKEESILTIICDYTISQQDDKLVFEYPISVGEFDKKLM
jgi:hypothetical protein